MKPLLFLPLPSIRSVVLACLCAAAISGCSDSVEVGTNNTDSNPNAQTVPNDSEGEQDAQSESPTAVDSDAQPPSTVPEPSTAPAPSGEPPQSVQASLELVQDKIFRIGWQSSADADFYRVLENPDGFSGFSPVSEELAATTQSFDHRVALFNRVNALYIVQACNTNGCVDSEALAVTGTLNNAIGTLKVSDAFGGSTFGNAVSFSADGNTLAVGARTDNGGGTGVNADSIDSISDLSGAVYVFVRSDGLWEQQTYIKANFLDQEDLFGSAVNLSADGNTLAVGTPVTDSAATGINGNEDDNSAIRAGSVHVYVRSDGQWQEQAYIKASNAEAEDQFGSSIALSADGNTLAVGAVSEDSAAIGINGDESDNSSINSGAVYIFARIDGLWQQVSFLKASNSESGDNFGEAVSLSADGNTLAVGASVEDSSATGINGDQADNSARLSGAVYVFVRSNGVWQQQAYLKAGDANFLSLLLFGSSVSLSADGDRLAVGALREDSSATGIDGDQADVSAPDSGAVYVFARSNDTWQQQAYVKASNTDADDFFGTSIALSADGNTLAVGSLDASSATGINGDQTDNSAMDAGAVYVFVHSDGLWQQRAYLKPSNTGRFERLDIEFGASSVALSADGSSLAVGAKNEFTLPANINGVTPVNNFETNGAVYLY